MSEAMNPEVIAAAADAAVDTAKTTIEWEGATFTLAPAVEHVPARAVLALEQEQAMSFIQGVIGVQGLNRAFAAFEQHHGHEPDIQEITPLVDLIAKHFGFTDAGE